MVVERIRPAFIITVILIGVVWGLFAVDTACAEPPRLGGDPLSQSYLQIGGSPLIHTERFFVDPGVGTADLDGYDFNLTGSVALHPNWSIAVRWDRLWETDDGFRDLAAGGALGSLELNENNLMAGPFFNYRVHPRVQVSLGLGIQWSHSSRVLTPVSGPVERADADDLGIYGAVEARAMLWRGLEFAARMTGSNIALFDNQVFFDFDLRYHFLRDMVDVGIGATVGTSDLEALKLTTRVYYMEVWHWARER